MPRLLFISTSLPPVADSQTIRNVFLINGLLLQGHDIHLIQAPAEGGDASLGKMLRARVEHTFTGAARYDTAVNWLRTHVSNPTLRMNFHRAMAKFAGMVCVPDVRADWGRMAYDAATAAFASAPDILVSSSGSNTAHVAAARLARLWGTPWIAEFGDPWSMNPIRPASHPHIRSRNRAIEKRTLSAAAGIVFTTDETRDAFLRERVAQGVPVTVIPCGYDASLLLPPDQTKPVGYADRTGTEIVIAYTGTADRGSRDLSPIIESFQRVMAEDTSISTVRIRLVGSVNRSVGGSLPRDGRVRVEHTGWVPYADSIEEIKRADALILAGNRSSLQIPAKVFNYLASGKPIFYLPQQPAESDPTWRLLRGHERCVAAPRGDDVISSITHDFLRRVAAGSYSDAERTNGIISWDEAGKRFAEFVEAVVAGVRSGRPGTDNRWHKNSFDARAHSPSEQIGKRR